MALTIRLSDEETKELESAMNIYGINTSSGMIKFMISNFDGTIKREHEQKKKNHELGLELESIKETIQERQIAKKKINTLQSRLTKFANS